jgi:hypothetical protein
MVKLIITVVEMSKNCLSLMIELAFHSLWEEVFNRSLIQKMKSKKLIWPQRMTLANSLLMENTTYFPQVQSGFYQKEIPSDKALFG